MKILLILPLQREDIKNPNEVSLPPLSLHVIAALTPPEHEVKIVDEYLEPLDFNEDCDVVGISCTTPTVVRGYKIADAFRQRGIPVVMGGVHPSILPDEALVHCDAVVIGEAENVWEDVLLDIQKNQLKKKYSKPFPELNRYVPLKTRKPNKQVGLGMIAAETTRGCPYTCNFCLSPIRYGRKQRHRPIDHVVRDLQESAATRVLFTDDNILGTPRYSKQLFEALCDLNIAWVGQSSLKVTERHPELVKLAKKSGCKGLFFGVESVSPAMSSMPKSYMTKEMMADQLKKIQDSGIHAHAAIMFGFDEDTESVFDDTLEFLMQTKVGTASFVSLIPYPGTPIYDQFLKENRILHHNWIDYDFYWGSVVYKPKHMSPEKLYTETIRVKKEFSRFGNVVKRGWANRRHPFLHTIVNLGMNKEAKMSLDQWQKRT